MKSLHRIAFVTAFVALCTGPTAAQVADSGNTIIVNGVRQTPEEVRQRAVAFVRGMGVAAEQTPAARWIVKACPTVVGVDRHYADIVEARLRAVATSVGVPLANAPCRPNLAVTFALDNKTLLKVLMDKRPGSFAAQSEAARKAMIEGAAPIIWWYSSDRRTKDGSANTEAASGIVGGVAGTGQSVVPTSADSETFAQVGSSIIGTRVVRGIVQANVVIDLNRADGATLGSVADYAALVAFAEIAPSAPPPEGSILALFGGPAGAARPRELSAFDTAFLRALYRLPLDREAKVQRNLLIRDVAAVGEGR